MTATDNFETVTARDLREGDLIDLYGDAYADFARDPDNGYEFELALVLGTEAETPDCIRVDHDSGAFGCPPGHRVYRRIPSAHMGTA